MYVLQLPFWNTRISLLTFCLLLENTLSLLLVGGYYAGWSRLSEK